MAFRFSFPLFLFLPSFVYSSLCISGKNLSCCALEGIVLTLPDRSKQWVLDDGLVAVASGLQLKINGKKAVYTQFLLSARYPSQILWVNGKKVKGPFLLTVFHDTIVLNGLSKEKNRSLFDCQKLMQLGAEKKKSARQQSSLKIRVLLTVEKLLADKKEFCFGSDAGFLIVTKSKKVALSQNQLVFSIEKQEVFLNKKLLLHGVYQIETAGDSFFFNGKLYKGSLIIHVEKGRVLFVNAVDLEEYVYAVLRSESWPGWSVEVNKALAVACRSYALAMMECAPSKSLYHVKSSNIHQQYNLYGDHDNKKIRDAVVQTRGMCLTYNQKPVLAMYDSCCGGLVPALIDELDFKKAPYLARSYACNYCKKSSLYAWKVTFEKSDLIALLKKIDVSVKSISHMGVSKHDKAGIVKLVKIKDRKKEVVVSGKAIYSVAKGIKSFSFSIRHTKNQVEFFGNGYGHPYGLCQWGACEMVKLGSLFDAVLKFYYPGTELKAITIKGI
jgi:stage II sporulation protein D